MTTECRFTLMLRQKWTCGPERGVWLRAQIRPLPASPRQTPSVGTRRCEESAGNSARKRCLSLYYCAVTKNEQTHFLPAPRANFASLGCASGHSLADIREPDSEPEIDSPRPKSGPRAGSSGHKRKKGAEACMAVGALVPPQTRRSLTCYDSCGSRRCSYGATGGCVRSSGPWPAGPK